MPNLLKPLIIPIVVIVVIVSGWASVLASPTPVASKFAAVIPWPVACTTDGCISSTAWQRQFHAEDIFAAHTAREAVSYSGSLTTLVRQHLVRHDDIVTPVNLADAARYREDILNLTDERVIFDAIGLSIADYDKHIILPFLEQERLRQMKSIDTLDELWQELSTSKKVYVFPLFFKWDPATSSVIDK